MFNIGYCFGATGSVCQWWDLPLALILSLVVIYLVRKKEEGKK